MRGLLVLSPAGIGLRDLLDADMTIAHHMCCTRALFTEKFEKAWRVVTHVLGKEVEFGKYRIRDPPHSTRPLETSTFVNCSRHKVASCSAEYNAGGAYVVAEESKETYQQSPGPVGDIVGGFRLAVADHILCLIIHFLCLLVQRAQAVNGGSVVARKRRQRQQHARLAAIKAGAERIHQEEAQAVWAQT